MSEFVTDQSFEYRLRQAISVAWLAFSRKVGGGIIPVNKEASMQLQYAYVLKQLLPFTIQNTGENADLELENGVKTKFGSNKIDIFLRGTSPKGETHIAIEMKCYRTIAASGGARGAHDIFMKDVYEDLQMLEEYVNSGIASCGVALIMNDMERFVNPSVKRGKCWAYDISQGYTFNGGKISVPIGGKGVAVNLQKTYTFNWSRFGNLWFMELEGICV